MSSEVDRMRLATARAAQLASAIASRVEAPEPTIRRGLESARAALGCELVVLTLSEPGRADLSIFDATDQTLRSLRLPIAGLAGSVCRWNRGEVVPDIARDPRRDELAARSGMRRFVCAPVRVKGAPRGTLIAASRDAAPSPLDAGDLLQLVLFADLIAIALGELEEQRNAQAFHERLSSLAARSFERWLGDELDPALAAVARERGLQLDGAGCDPVLPEIGRALRADAVVLSAPGFDGVWRVADSWAPPGADVRLWTETAADVSRWHAEGRFSLVARATGFGDLEQDLRVLLRAPDGARVLHVLSRASRGPFSANDIRAAEMAAVRLGWSLHAAAMETRLKQWAASSSLPLLPEGALEPFDAAA